MAALINDESKPGYGAVPLLQKPEKSSRLRQGAVLAAVFCAGMGAATFVKRNPFAASPLAFAVEDCDFGDACEACGMGLFESVDTETFCSTFDATCSADCSEGTIECIESELCESSDDSAGDDHLAHCEADDACKGCAMGLFESTDSETFCSTLDATCSDCSAANTECIKDGLCGDSDDSAGDDHLAHCEVDDACKGCAMGLFESTDSETFCSTLDTTCSDCSAANTECIKDGLCGDSDDSAGDDHLAHCEVDDACKGCAMGLFESTDSETFCSTLDATCSDCSAENTECIKAGLCESGDDDDDDPLAQCGFTDVCESCGKGLFESVEIETFCSTFETTCSSECASSTIGCVESVLCEYSGAKVAWK